MKINNKLLTEIISFDESGNEHIPDNLNSNPPENYRIHHIFVPNFLIKKIVRTPIIAEINNCDHKDTKQVPFYSNFYAVQCQSCGGVRVRDVSKDDFDENDKWFIDRPLELSVQIFNSWPIDLVEAMVKSGDYSLKDSIIITSKLCLRCQNELRIEYKLQPLDLKNYNGSCDFCE